MASEQPQHIQGTELPCARGSIYEPCFELRVPLCERELEARLVRRLGERDVECIGWVTPPYAELHVPEARRHFWSPRLALTFDEQPDGTHVHAIFRAEPDVFTGFMFAHTAFGSLAIAGLFWGLAQLTLGHTAWALIGLPIGAAASLLLYLGAMAGQKLGREEMVMLRRELERALD